MMPPERTTNIEAEGTDFPSLLEGFSCIGMPPERRSAARALVEEVAKLNGANDFHWYKPAGSNELSCYWDASDVNLLWIGPGHVHIRADGPVIRPDRPIDWRKAEGEWVGWTLPGFVAGESGTGGSSRAVEKVPCPRHLAPPQPAGAECPECCEVHTVDGAS